VFDRDASFGYRNSLNYRIVVNWLTSREFNGRPLIFGLHGRIFSGRICDTRSHSFQKSSIPIEFIRVVPIKL
jgi:hypothetical protein